MLEFIIMQIFKRSAVVVFVRELEKNKGKSSNALAFFVTFLRVFRQRRHAWNDVVCIWYWKIIYQSGGIIKCLTVQPAEWNLKQGGFLWRKSKKILFTGIKWNHMITPTNSSSSRVLRMWVTAGRRTRRARLFCVVVDEGIRLLAFMDGVMKL